ncbi:MAG: hypothetical protein AAGC81_04335 [Pseudomonadota bacterium]
MKNTGKRILTGALVSSALAGPALACEPVHSVRYQVEGMFEIRVNGVLAHFGTTSSGFLNLSDGVAQGENTVSVMFMKTQEEGYARFAVHKACEGQLPDETPVASLELNDSDELEMTFVRDAAVAAPYPGAETTDGEGLEEAVRALQTAVRARDVKAVFALHGPLLTSMEADGAPMDKINDHVTRMLTQGDIAVADEIVIRPLMGGLAWEVSGSNYSKPVSIYLKADGGEYNWSSGTRWIYVDDAWAVLEP